MRAVPAERPDHILQIGDLEAEPVPAPWRGQRAVRHRLAASGFASGCAEHEPQVAARQHGEAGAGCISSRTFEASHETMVPDTQTGTARERAERLVRHVAEVAVDSTFSRCIPALIEGATRDARLREFHHRYSAERRHSLVTVIEEGIAGGEFAADTDVELAATALLGAIFYGRLMAAESFQPGRASDLVNALLRQPAAEQQTTADGQSHQAVPIGTVE
jgi:hypothetical protein